MTKKVEYNKLVRDKIPEITKESGNEPIYHVATDDEYRQKLLEKVIEELEEFKEDSSYKEMSDLMEIIYSIQKEFNLDKDKIEETRKKRANERGSFEKKLILEYVIENKKYK